MGRRAGWKPKLVIFDLDGTLIDSEPISLGAWLKAGKEFGLEMHEEEIHQFLGRNNQSIRKLAMEIYGEDLPFEKIHDRKLEISRLAYEKGVPLKPGVRETLKALEDLKIPCCVATSSSRERAGALIKSHDLTEVFDFVVTGEDITHSKPHPEIFLQCFERAGVRPEDCLVVEDSRNGVVAARRSGAKVALIPDAVEADREMKEQADFVFSSLMEVKDLLTEEA